MIHPLHDDELDGPRVSSDLPKLDEAEAHAMRALARLNGLYATAEEAGRAFLKLSERLRQTGGRFDGHAVFGSPYTQAES
jgi:hypothetical protein